MQKDLDKYIYLADLFIANGYKLFLVGGSSRDYLLKRDFHDFDVATDATPDEIKAILPDVNMTFAKYGSTSIKIEGTKFDITTFRIESHYSDHRHPLEVKFIKNIEEDYKRRDFTINAIYIDRDFKIYDFGTSLSDLEFLLIRTIGEPRKRLREDPLRILRAIRFSLLLDFEIEESLYYSIRELSPLLSELSEDKINEEIKKMLVEGISIFEIKSAFQKYNVLPGYKYDRIIKYDKRSNRF
jgi:tRNA nucleotidyltransferase (CCA-adding enzyme)